MDMLDRLYAKFDAIARKHDIFKVETIGDAYMAVANLVKQQSNHAERIGMFALEVCLCEIPHAENSMVEQLPEYLCAYHKSPAFDHCEGMYF